MSEKKARGKLALAHARDTQKLAKSTTKLAAKKGNRGRTSTGFTDEERAVMRERAQAMKAAARADKAKTEGVSKESVRQIILCPCVADFRMASTRTEYWVLSTKYSAAGDGQPSNPCLRFGLVF